ncbi:MAG: helix-turn-helix domain-containing protein [Legionella sp.]|nr:helix-turn-helix domain-containing protein [Legionella sp.]
MNKPLSTYERKMQGKDFKRKYEKHYKELLFSELLVSIMEGDAKTVRALAAEADISPSIIQDLRSGRQQDIKVTNLIKIAKVLGYEVILQKGEEKLSLQDDKRGDQHRLSVVSSF